MGGALVCAELSSALPRAGGVYVFLSETYSRALGFLWGWAAFWSVHTGIIAAIAMVFARYAGSFVADGRRGAQGRGRRRHPRAVGGQLRGCSPRRRRADGDDRRKGGGGRDHHRRRRSSGSGDGDRAAGVERRGRSARATSCLRSAPASSPSAAGTWSPTPRRKPAIRSGRFRARSSIGTLVVTRVLPRAEPRYLSVLPIDRGDRVDRVAADTFDVLVGPTGARLVSALVDGVGVRRAQRRHSRGAAHLLLDGPGRPAVQVARATCTRPIARPPGDRAAGGVGGRPRGSPGRYRDLFTRVIYTEWIFFGLLALGVVIMRRRPDYTRSGGCRACRSVPVAFAIASFAIALNQIRVDPLNSAIGLLMVLIGLPVYWIGIKSRRQHAVRSGIASEDLLI